MVVYRESEKLPVVDGLFTRPTYPPSRRRLAHLCDHLFSGGLLVFVFAFFSGLIHWVFMVVFIIIFVVAAVCIVVAVMWVGMEVVVWEVCVGAVFVAVVAVTGVTV